MAELMKDIFWLTSADYHQLLYVSPAFEITWGRPLASLYTYPGGYLNWLIDSIHPDDQERITANVTQKCPCWGEYIDEYRIIRPDGSIRWLRSHFFPIQNPLGEIWAIASFSEDITPSVVDQSREALNSAIATVQDITAQKQEQLELEKVNQELETRVAERTAQLKQANTLLEQEIAERKQAQKALKAQKDFLQAIIDTNPNVIFVKDQNGKFILANQVFAELYDMRVEDVLGKTDAQIHSNRADLDRFEREDQEACTTKQTKVVSETVFITPTGAIRYINGIKKPLVLSDEQTWVLGVGTDVTQLKQAQAELNAQKEFLQTVLDTNPNLIWVKDKEDRVILANQACADFFKTTVEELIGKTNPELHANQANAQLCIAQDRQVITTSQEIFIPEECFSTPSGELRWFQTIKKPLFFGSNQVSLILGVSTDITERKNTKTQLKESLQEKELLLQEIHHRVKNNLQVIYSLLDLQSQRIDNPTMLEVFRESCNRVRSMALIHEQLYQSRNFAKINLLEYVKDLMNYLSQVYGVNPDIIKLEIDIEDVPLNINTAISCGLIINELVSNALKHAFSQERDGIIKISLYSDSETQFKLIIKDNGIGFPQNFNLQTVKSLGLQLIKILVNQIEGTLEFNHQIGAEFKITFSQPIN